MCSPAAMVACQMMYAAPERVASATLLGTTLTGWEMLIPLHGHPVRLAKVRFSISARLASRDHETCCLMCNPRPCRRIPLQV